MTKWKSVAKINLMARDPTVSDHLTSQGFRAMRKAVIPERHGVIHSGISDQGRLRMVRNVTVRERRRVRRWSRVGRKKRLPIKTIKTGVVNRGFKLKHMATIEAKNKGVLV